MDGDLNPCPSGGGPEGLGRELHTIGLLPRLQPTKVTPVAAGEPQTGLHDRRTALWGVHAMSETKKTLAQMLQEKSAAAKDSVTRGAQVVGAGVQKGSQAVAQGAQALGENVQQGGQTAVRAAGEGLEQCGKVMAQGAQVVGDGVQQGAQAVGQGAQKSAQVVGEGVQKGVQVIKEHPQEAAVVAGAAVVAAGALPFTPFGVPAALAVVAAAAQGAKATQDAMRECGLDGESSENGAASAITAIAGSAETTQQVLKKCGLDGQADEE